MNLIFKTLVFACTLLLAQAASAQINTSKTFTFTGDGNWTDEDRWDHGWLHFRRGTENLKPTDTLIIQGNCHYNGHSKPRFNCVVIIENNGSFNCKANEIFYLIKGSKLQMHGGRLEVDSLLLYSSGQLEIWHPAVIKAERMFDVSEGTFINHGGEVIAGMTRYKE